MTVTEQAEQGRHDAAGATTGRKPVGGSGRRLRRWLSIRTIGAVYVLLLLATFFSIAEPDSFPTAQTAKTILNQYAVTGIMALAVTVPLVAGVFDLSVAAVMSFASMLSVILLTETGLPVVLVIVLVILACCVIGLFNAFVVAVFKIHSFIGTLGSGAIVAALVVAISGNKTIVGERVAERFSEPIALSDVGGITIPVLYLLVLMLVVGLALEQTKTGRFLYATGFDTEASRLAGLRVRWLQGGSLVTSAVIAGIGGIVLAARLASSTPGVGNSYLLPAFAAAFLGATQFRHGRFNAWGTVLAVMLVGVASYGLLLMAAPEWTTEIATGVILLVAVGLTGFERRSIGSKDPEADAGAKATG
jgi:ribose transport system permease protein